MQNNFNHIQMMNNMNMNNMMPIHHIEEMQDQDMMTEVLNIAKIKEGFYIGDKISAISIDVIIQFKITHMINATGNQIMNQWESIGISYLTLNWSETPNQILFDNKDEIANRIVEFVDGSTMGKGEGLLAHSFKGQNRVCIVVLIYLMKKYKWSLNKSIQFLKSKKQDVEIPNYFMKQLENFEMRLKKRGELTRDTPWEYADLSDPEEKLLRNTYLNGIKFDLNNVELNNNKNDNRHIFWADTNPYQKFPIEIFNTENDLFYQKNIKPVTVHQSLKVRKGCIKGMNDTMNNNFIMKGINIQNNNNINRLKNNDMFKNNINNLEEYKNNFEMPNKNSNNIFMNKQLQNNNWDPMNIPNILAMREDKNNMNIKNNYFKNANDNNLLMNKNISKDNKNMNNAIKGKLNNSANINSNLNNLNMFKDQQDNPQEMQGNKINPNQQQDDFTNEQMMDMRVNNSVNISNINFNINYNMVNNKGQQIPINNSLPVNNSLMMNNNNLKSQQMVNDKQYNELIYRFGQEKNNMIKSAGFMNNNNNNNLMNNNNRQNMVMNNDFIKNKNMNNTQTNFGPDRNNNMINCIPFNKERPIIENQTNNNYLNVPPMNKNNIANNYNPIRSFNTNGRAINNLGNNFNSNMRNKNNFGANKPLNNYNPNLIKNKGTRPQTGPSLINRNKNSGPIKIKNNNFLNNNNIIKKPNTPDLNHYNSTSTGFIDNNRLKYSHQKDIKNNTMSNGFGYTGMNNYNKKIGIQRPSTAPQKDKYQVNQDNNNININKSNNQFGSNYGKGIKYNKRPSSAGGKNKNNNNINNNKNGYINNINRNYSNYNINNKNGKNNLNTGINRRLASPQIYPNKNNMGFNNNNSNNKTNIRAKFNPAKHRVPSPVIKSTFGKRPPLPNNNYKFNVNKSDKFS